MLAAVNWPKRNDNRDKSTIFQLDKIIYLSLSLSMIDMRSELPFIDVIVVSSFLHDSQSSCLPSLFAQSINEPWTIAFFFSGLTDSWDPDCAWLYGISSLKFLISDHELCPASSSPLRMGPTRSPSILPRISPKILLWTFLPSRSGFLLFNTPSVVKKTPPMSSIKTPTFYARSTSNLPISSKEVAWDSWS